MEINFNEINYDIQVSKKIDRGLPEKWSKQIAYQTKNKNDFFLIYNLVLDLIIKKLLMLMFVALTYYIILNLHHVFRKLLIIWFVSFLRKLYIFEILILLPIIACTFLVSIFSFWRAINKIKNKKITYFILVYLSIIYYIK